MADGKPRGGDDNGGRGRKRHRHGSSGVLSIAFPLAEAGKSHGPCVDENCGHERCSEKREVANSTCAFCKEKIGFGKLFDFALWRGFVHQACRNAYEGSDSVVRQKLYADLHIN